MSDPNRKECSYSEKPNSSDTISRQAAIDAINEIINRFERILQGIRESKVDDSVCGMCEYDGAYIGQSGDWCNECPGFEKNNCFKLSDKCRTRWLKSVELSSAQPERKKGQWEMVPDPYGFFDEIPVCSECGCTTEMRKTYKFCPSCGADMRGEQDETN